MLPRLAFYCFFLFFFYNCVSWEPGRSLDEKKGLRPLAGRHFYSDPLHSPRWLALKDSAARYYKSPSLSLPKIRNILDQFTLFSEGPPLMLPTKEIEELAGHLYSLGLPLEAAELVKLTKNWNEDTQASISKLKVMTAHSLAAGGHFSTALKFARQEGLAIPLRKKLAWSILAGDHEEALEYIDKRIDEAEDKPDLNLEPWTGLSSPISYHILRGLVYYLDGRIAKAIDVLEDISDKFPKEGPGSKPRYVALLRLGQIHLPKEPKLAQRLAEDVFYAAQEHDWSRLEYQATNLDGWANYFLKKYFKALIHFTKAKNILQTSPAQSRARLELHRLGILAARLKLNPRGNHRWRLASVKNFIYARSFDPKLAFLLYGMPLTVDREFLIQTIVTHQNSRGHHSSALQTLWKHHVLVYQGLISTRGQKSRRNPGGIAGLPAFIQRQALFKKLNPAQPTIKSRFRIHPSLRSLAERLQRQKKFKAALQKLNPGDFYLFHFGLAKGRHVYLIHPAQQKRAKKDTGIGCDMSI